MKTVHYDLITREAERQLKIAAASHAVHEFRYAMALAIYFYWNEMMLRTQNEVDKKRLEALYESAGTDQVKVACALKVLISARVAIRHSG